MLIEEQQLKTAELVALPPLFELLVDLGRDVGRHMLRLRSALLRPERRQLRQTHMAAQMALERDRKIAQPPPQPLFLRDVGPHARFDFDRQIAAVVDELPPQLASLPPAVVRSIRAEDEQRAENQA